MEHINLKYVNCKIMKGLTSHFTDTKKRKKKHCQFCCHAITRESKSIQETILHLLLDKIIIVKTLGKSGLT